MDTPENRYRSLPANDPHYAAIGLVASNWAKLERNADETIWELLQANPPMSASVTAQMIGLRPRMMAIVTLLHNLGASESDIKKVHDLLHDSYGMANRRNRVIHDPWFHNLRTNARSRYAATTNNKGVPVLDFVEVPITELEALATEIDVYDQKMWVELDSILQTFRDTRPGWFSVVRSD